MQTAIVVPEGATERLFSLVLEARKPLATGRFTLQVLERVSLLTSIVPEQVEKAVVHILATAFVGVEEKTIHDLLSTAVEVASKPNLKMASIEDRNYILSCIVWHLGIIASTGLGVEPRESAEQALPSLFVVLVVWWAYRGVKQ